MLSFRYVILAPYQVRGKLQREFRVHLENPGLLLEFIPVKIGTGVTDLFSGFLQV